MPRGSKAKKDPYELVPLDERKAIEGSTDQQINDRIATVAKTQAATDEAMKQDQELTSRKNAVKVAMMGYVEARKANKQRIAYARSILDARGKDAGSSAVEPVQSVE